MTPGTLSQAAFDCTLLCTGRTGSACTEGLVAVSRRTDEAKISSIRARFAQLQCAGCLGQEYEMCLPMAMYAFGYMRVFVCADEFEVAAFLAFVRYRVRRDSLRGMAWPRCYEIRYQLLLYLRLC